jgi:uncharacterized membrane protein
MILVRFLHLLGIGLWLGGGTAALVLVGGAKSDAPVRRADHLQVLARVYAWIVAPGAILATGSGLAITMMVSSAGFGARLGEPLVAAMQAVGVLAGALEVFISFPTSQRLGRLVAASDPAEVPLAGERFRIRITRVLAVTLTLVVVALYLGIAGR